ncbi:MAG: ergothioneine biosynthesis protein EgtB [Mycobacteriales bacterium]
MNPARARTALAASRARTHALTEADDPYLVEQVDPLMSPLVWDLAHIGQQEELWLLRHLEGAAPMLRAEVDGLYDAFRHPRATRTDLPLLTPDEARRYLAAVRDRVDDGLARGAAFEHGLVVQHENQHVETMLATHQLRGGSGLLVASDRVPAARPVDPSPVLVPGGPCVVGVDPQDEPWSLDNERPAHVVDVPAFLIGRHPVTNAQWQDFVADGGYGRRDLWSPDGWAHRQEAGLVAPMAQRPDGTRRRFGVDEPVPPDEPVQHVSYWEADAFARWAGARLPTEVEWETACAWDPAASARRRWPWGADDWDPSQANLAGAVGALRPAPVGAYPAGASAYGVEQMIGDVWEWTASPLRPWPGFRPMVYDTYSQPFFGDGYRVLRGGSWAVSPDAVRPSFRNWDLPVRRQIFCGVRLAWDAPEGR